jgi:hypothetical protein
LNLSFSSFDYNPLGLEDIDNHTEPPPRVSIKTSISDPEPSKKRRIRKYKEDQWNKRYQELLLFRNDEGHVMVPHCYPQNRKLAQWVKR